MYDGEAEDEPDTEGLDDIDLLFVIDGEGLLETVADDDALIDAVCD